MEQHTNDRSPGRGGEGAKPPEAETLLALVRSTEAANVLAF